LNIAHRRKLITWARGAAVATALGATVFMLTACQGNRSGNTTASPTSATAASTTATPSQDDQLALQILDAIVKGDFETATARFDSQMKQKLTPRDLFVSWTTYQEAFGKYQSHGAPQDVPLGELTVVNTPLQMERQPGELRVTFHPDQTVAGLFFLKAETPVS
jgi:Protein of unknown function (DUF3887)